MVGAVRTPSRSRPRRHRSRAIAVVLAALVVTTWVSVDSAAAQTPETFSFAYTGQPQAFTVPAGITQLSAIVMGAAGGQGSSSAEPGASGAVYGVFDVTPGDVLTIWVGGSSIGRTAGWGFGCGGEGGGVPSGPSGVYPGGGGGGSSALTLGSFGPINPGDCTTRPSVVQMLLHGGGGGGGGGGAFVLNTKPGIYFGGVGGNGGSPAGPGAPGQPLSAGGCGGCSPTVNGGDGNPGILQGAGGAGGGGFAGGDGGDIGAFGGGGGGGGGSSAIAGSATNFGFLPGTGAGNGSVILSTSLSQFFSCTGTPQHVTLPAGTSLVNADAQGGHGGTLGIGKSAAGGAAGEVMGGIPVAAGDQVTVYVGCGGAAAPGWGYGTGGTQGKAESDWGIDGGSGGGSSAVTKNGTPQVVAGGGGGGGGQGGAVFSKGGGAPGGAGGFGGIAPQPGTQGQPGGYIGGRGGQGGGAPGPNGANGWHASGTSQGGGGGAGGAGWYGGEGGGGGDLGIDFDGGGGGGGGGGVSHFANGTSINGSDTSSLSGDGLVQLTFVQTGPAAISVAGGSQQHVTIGDPFPEPLQALVSDPSGQPVPNVTVVFILPASGVSGTFSGAAVAAGVTDVNGIATSPPFTANLSAGSWSATATVAGASNTAQFALTNLISATSTAVTASFDPATPNESVTFTATVTASEATSGTPTGSVQFVLDGSNFGAPVALAGGTATSSATSGLTLGNHTIQAQYAGTPNYSPSNASLTLPVELTPTATQVTSSANPSDISQSVTFTATITVPAGNAPYSGTVQFAVDGSPLGAPQAASNGTAISPAISTLALGSHSVTAATAATATYEASNGSMTQVVDPAGAAVKVSTSANPIEYGVGFTIAANVVPRPPVVLTPTGSVIFTVGGNPGCTGTLSSGSTSCAQPTTLAPGSYDVVGAYSGDANFNSSSGSMVQRVVKAHTLTTITGSPAGSSVFGQSVTFTAHVARATVGSGTPGGSVQFELDGAALGGPIALSGGDATSPAVMPSAAPHTLFARYSGDTFFAVSSSTAAYRVDPAPTSVALSAAPEPSQLGQPVVMTAAVAAIVPNAMVTPNGRVLFLVDGLPLGGSVVLTNGQATSPPITNLKTGQHDFAARYLPATGDFFASRAAIVHDVARPSVTVIASSENPTGLETAITFKAHVGPRASDGTLSFSIDGTPVAGCQGVTVHESEGQCSVPQLTAGSHLVVAAYSGDPVLDPSSGTFVELVIGGPVPRFTG